MLKIPHCAGMIDWGSWRPTPEITVGMPLYQFIGICKPKSAREVEKWRIPLYCFHLRDRIDGKDTIILCARSKT
jgi:hypothetical protein